MKYKTLIATLILTSACGTSSSKKDDSAKTPPPKNDSTTPNADGTTTPSNTGTTVTGDSTTTPAEADATKAVAQWIKAETYDSNGLVSTLEKSYNADGSLKEDILTASTFLSYTTYDYEEKKLSKTSSFR